MMLRTPAAKRPRFLPILGASDRSMEPQLESEEDASCGELVRYDESDRRLDAYPEQDDLCDDGYDSMRCSYKCRNMVKSELLENLDHREKQVAELESINDALRSRLEAAEVENQRLLGRVKSLDQSVAAALAQEQGSRLQRMEDTDQFEQRFRTQLMRCNELQEKFLEETRLRAEAESSARAAKAEVSTLKIELDSQVERSSREIQRLERQVELLQNNSNSYPPEMMTDEDYNKLATLEHQLSFRELHSDLLKQEVEEQTEAKLNLERRLAELESERTVRVTGSREADIIIKTLRDELGYQEAELAEARKFKGSQLKLEFLQEQLSAEKSRADEAEAQLASQTDLKLRISSLESEIEAWEEMVRALPGSYSRNDVPKKLSEMQRETLLMLSENGDLKSKLHELQSALEKANLEKQSSMDAVLDARQKAEEAYEKAARLELQVQRLVKERDSLQSVLSSYDQEESLFQRAEPAATPPATPEASKRKRIEELEKLLQSAQGEIIRLEKKLEDSITTAMDQRKKSEALASDLAKAEAKVSSLQRETEQLRGEVGLLEHKIACGEFDPSRTKILKLRTSLETPGTHLGHHAEEEPTMVLQNRRKLAAVTDKIGSLELEISILKKRESRYMQVFADKAFTFRTACGLIFGYEIMMNEKPDSAVTLFKLSSIYSRDKEKETLEFQYTPDGQSVGRIDMLGNDYTSSPEIERQVTTFLKGFRSIPALMANLTLEMFNKVTIG